MQLWQALFLGALQGVSELFPVSSLAHTILIPALLNWGIDQQASNFLAFVVALHLATAIALVIYLWREWREVILSYYGSIKRRQLVYDKTSKFAWLLIAGTVLVGLFGVVFEKQLRNFFENPKLFWLVALFLILNGGVMLYGDYLRKRASLRHSSDGVPLQQEKYQSVAAATRAQTHYNNNGAVSGTRVATSTNSRTPTKLKEVADLSFIQGGLVGSAQILALFPGISRSGATMVGGLLSGLNYEAAARFSFMLATPVIGLAALLKLPDLFKPEAQDILYMTLPAALVAGITAYVSVRFLMRYFETRRLSPFGYYCVLFGAVAFVILGIRG